MRILHVIAQLPSRTGSGVYYSNVVDRLKKYNHEQAAVYAVQDDFKFDLLDNKMQYPVCFKTEQIPFPIAGMSDVMPYENTVYSEMDEEMFNIWSDSFESILLKVKAEFNPDVIISHHLWILTSMVTEIFKDSVIIGICHNTDIRQAEQHPEMKQRYTKNLKNLHAVFSLSEAQLMKISDIFQICPDKIKAIGGGFDEKLFFPATNKKPKNQIEIVFSAKIERSKGVYELIKAFKKVSAIKSNVHLYIIGVPNSENARILNDTMGGSDNITVVPISNQKELASFIRDRDIFVMPSFFEGLGLMAIESLASGLFVVATEIEALIALLGQSVNKSGAIEYVKLPRIYDTDKPFEEDIDSFIEELADKLVVQIERIKQGEVFSDEIVNEINKHSWSGLVEKINNEIIALVKR